MQCEMMYRVVEQLVEVAQLLVEVVVSQHSPVPLAVVALLARHTQRRVC
jgi:hypothetical protein